MRGVYFVGCEGSQFVKVGYAIDIADRFSNLQGANPSALYCHGVLPGAPRIERLLHRYLAGRRGLGEWFDREPALAALEEFTPVPSDDLESRIAQRIAESEAAITARADRHATSFRAAVIQSVQRADDKHGRAATQAALGYSPEAMRRSVRGVALPILNRFFNLLLIDDTLLDEAFGVYGLRLVDKGMDPVDWDEVAIAAAELSAEILRAKGHVSHLDQPKLKALVRRVIAAGQGAA